MCSFCALFYELTIIRFRIIIQNYPISDKMYLKGDWKRMEEQRRKAMKQMALYNQLLKELDDIYRVYA